MSAFRTLLACGLTAAALGLAPRAALAQRTFKVPEMYAGIFTLAVFGYCLNRIFLVLEARLIRWHHESSGRT